MFIGQQAYNAHQEARGWAMTGDPTQVNRTLGHADELSERAAIQQADAPPNMYWYGSGFFTLQRGLTWHTLEDARFAGQAATELTTGGLHELPAAEALTTAGQAERAVAQARQALTVCRTTRSTRLAHALQRAYARMWETWPTHPAIRELGDKLRSLSGAR